MTLGMNISMKTAVGISAVVILFVALVELLLGRVLYCTCNQIWLWSSDIMSTNNSQHLLDPYSFSHILHGFIFFLAGWLIYQRWPISLGWRLVLAAVIEAGWEIWENTSFAIERYREATISLNYYGDSVVNSVGDIIVCLLAWWLASRLPWRLTLALAIAIEVILVLVVKDNLTLNILMLIYPIAALRQWQAGA